MSQKLTSVVGQFVRLFAADLPGVPDGELLGRYLADRDEAAFTALIRRHGPMVLGVCRRILRNESDVDDAFQATFLVLVRKAATIKPRGMVGNWLHGVAYQTAVRARALRARQCGREIQMANPPDVSQPASENGWAEIAPIIDAELHSLPEKYRIPVLLCDLEGMSRKEAALHLNWPEGTVAGRLARARKLLASRLTRRGVTLTSALLVAALSNRAALSQLPLPSLQTTIRATILFVAGSSAGVISTFTAELTQGVLTAMFISKLKTAAVAILLLGLIGLGSTMVTQPDASAQQPFADPRMQPDPMQPRSVAQRGTVWEGMFEDGEPAAKKNLDIQGVWILQSAVTGGQSVKDEIQIVLKNNLMIWNEKGSVMGFSYKIIAEKEPNQIDLTSLEEGKTKGKSVLGIYKCDGDTLTLCESAPGKDRPTRFSAAKGPGSGTSLQIFRRASAVTKDPTHPVPSPYFPAPTAPRMATPETIDPRMQPPMTDPASYPSTAPLPVLPDKIMDPAPPAPGGSTKPDLPVGSNDDPRLYLVVPHPENNLSPEAPQPAVNPPAHAVAPPAAKNDTEYSFTADVTRQILRNPAQPATLAFPKITLDANQQATVSIQEGELEYSLKITAGNGSKKGIHRFETTISRLNSEGRIVQVVGNTQMSIYSDRVSVVNVPITKDGATEIYIRATAIPKQPDSALLTR